jgi:hypothetical protein
MAEQLQFEVTVRFAQSIEVGAAWSTSVPVRPADPKARFMSPQVAGYRTSDNIGGRGSDLWKDGDRTAQGSPCASGPKKVRGVPEKARKARKGLRHNAIRDVETIGRAVTLNVTPSWIFGYLE